MVRSDFLHCGNTGHDTANRSLSVSCEISILLNNGCGTEALALFCTDNTERSILICSRTFCSSIRTARGPQMIYRHTYLNTLTWLFRATVERALHGLEDFKHAAGT